MSVTGKEIYQINQKKINSTWEEMGKEYKPSVCRTGTPGDQSKYKKELASTINQRNTNQNNNKTSFTPTRSAKMDVSQCQVLAEL